MEYLGFFIIAVCHIERSRNVVLFYLIDLRFRDSRLSSVQADIEMPFETAQ
mgnify:CR=1 FL=1